VEKLVELLAAEKFPRGKDLSAGSMRLIFRR
jgi:hypothetical protein